ncbi:MAG: putative DNA-binding domain-containing protein [Pseudomonadota bacterium]
MNSLPSAEPAFSRRQREFAEHIRHPEKNPRPADVEARRMAIYNELFFNNLEDFLASSYPVLHRITPDHRWQTLVRAFYANHACRTPLFSRLAEEFLTYLQREREETEGDPPFMAELAHYEWVELALTLSDADRHLPPLDPNGDLLKGHPLISPLAWHFSYRYPVHRIGPAYLPEQPETEPTHLLVYRDRQDQVGFLEINPVTLSLLEALESGPEISGQTALETIIKALDHTDPGLVMQAGSGLLNELRQRDILLGTAL